MVDKEENKLEDIILSMLKSNACYLCGSPITSPGIVRSIYRRSCKKCEENKGRNNMVFKREIERKFTIKQSYEEAYAFLTTVSAVKVNAHSFDTYWRASGVDFVRLRDNSREITVKVTDKHTVVDRIEENVEVAKESMGAAERMLNLLLGPPAIKITKKFSVFTVNTTPAPGTNLEAVLCLYQVREDGSNRVFFEVEAESLAIVDHVIKDVIQGNLTLKAENRSLFQIFEKVAA